MLWISDLPTWVSSYASQEATVITTLYRDLNGYPSPDKDDLRSQLRAYTKLIIEKEWPTRQRGEIIDDRTKLLTGFQDLRMTFEPTTKGQEIIHSEAFQALNRMIAARRQRVEAVSVGIRGVLWAVVILGAMIAIGGTSCFRITASASMP